MSDPIVDISGYPVPAKYQPLFRRALKGSRAAAIRAMCLACVGYNPEDVQTCRLIKCPLHGHRLSNWERRQAAQKAAVKDGQAQSCPPTPTPPRKAAEIDPKDASVASEKQGSAVVPANFSDAERGDRKSVV